MKIKLYDDAAERYNRRVRSLSICGGATFKQLVWTRVLREVQWQWLPVETNYLFADQYTTPGNFCIGAEDVEEVDYEGDEQLERIYTALRKTKENEQVYQEHEEYNEVSRDSRKDFCTCPACTSPRISFHSMIYKYGVGTLRDAMIDGVYYEYLQFDRVFPGVIHHK
jgi:hypothetical protein